MFAKKANSRKIKILVRGIITQIDYQTTIITTSFFSRALQEGVGVTTTTSDKMKKKSKNGFAWGFFVLRGFNSAIFFHTKT